MRSKIKSASAALLLAVAGSAAAQVPPGNPGGMPEGPQGRPLGMGENDSATNPSVQDQINRATQNAAGREAADASRGRVRTRPARPDELTLGAEVRDRKGVPVGAIQLVEADGAVVQTQAGKVKVPLEAFGIDKKGIIIGVTKAEFDSLVAGATAKPAG